MNYDLIDKRKPITGMGWMEFVYMWTREELQEIRERADLEGSIDGGNHKWRQACYDLAAAADRLDAMTNRIELGLEVATLQPSNEV